MLAFSVYSQDMLYQVPVADIANITYYNDSLKTTNNDTLDQKNNEKIKIIRRDFKYRDQVGAALGTMVFITIILTTIQAWNPN